MISPGLILAIALALVHGFAARLPIFSLIPRFRWTSFAGGVSLGYVFLEIFPELSHTQEEIQHSEILLVQYLEKHVYILALIGLIVFYGLDLLVLRAAMSLGVFAHDIDKSPIPQNFMSVVEMARIDRFSYRFINPRKGSNQHCYC